MDLKKIIDALHLEVKVEGKGLDIDVSGGYMSDLLSDVIANSRKGDIWITLQVHPNIVAVAVLKELAGVIIIGGKEPTQETLHKAQKEEVVILTSPLPAFTIAGKLYEIGLGK